MNILGADRQKIEALIAEEHRAYKEKRDELIAETGRLQAAQISSADNLSDISDTNRAINDSVRSIQDDLAQLKSDLAQLKSISDQQRSDLAQLKNDFEHYAESSNKQFKISITVSIFAAIFAFLSAWPSVILIWSTMCGALGKLQ